MKQGTLPVKRRHPQPGKKQNPMEHFVFRANHFKTPIGQNLLPFNFNLYLKRIRLSFAAVCWIFLDLSLKGFHVFLRLFLHLQKTEYHQTVLQLYTNGSLTFYNPQLRNAFGFQASDHLTPFHYIYYTTTGKNVQEFHNYFLSVLPFNGSCNALNSSHAARSDILTSTLLIIAYASRNVNAVNSGNMASNPTTFSRSTE